MGSPGRKISFATLVGKLNSELRNCSYGRFLRWQTSELLQIQLCRKITGIIIVDTS